MSTGIKLLVCWDADVGIRVLGEVRVRGRLEGNIPAVAVLVYVKAASGSCQVVSTGAHTLGIEHRRYSAGASVSGVGRGRGGIG